MPACPFWTLGKASLTSLSGGVKVGVCQVSLPFENQRRCHFPLLPVLEVSIFIKAKFLLP